MARNSVRERPVDDGLEGEGNLAALATLTPPQTGGKAAQGGLARSFTRKGELLSRKLNRLAEEVWAPEQTKHLRPFQTQEVAALLGVTERYVRQMANELDIPKLEGKAAGRRVWTLEEIARLRTHLDAKSPGRYLPHRREGEHLQVLNFATFKGGSGKSTQAVHAAQYFALRGYRVLAIDLDPQASLTTMLGVTPELHVGPHESLFGAITYQDDADTEEGRAPRPMREVVRQTYFAGLDLVPASLELAEFETESPRSLMLRHPSPFFTRISSAIAEVADDYDIVILDSPPQLGFVTMAGLHASTGLIVTVHPQMIDVASMAQFMTLAGSLMEVLEGQGGRTVPLDFEKILVTRHTPSDQPQMAVVTFLRSLFRTDVLAATMVNSTAVADCGLARQTLYEAVRDSSNKRTYDRAVQSMNGVNAELEADVLRAWQRTPTRVED